MADSRQSESRARERKPTEATTGPASRSKCWATCCAKAVAPRPVALMEHSMATAGSPCCWPRPRRAS
eukprot:7148075-Alexandrium_andersonii.AAC.1